MCLQGAYDSTGVAAGLSTLFWCHGEFGTPDLWHPRAKYPREIGTLKQNTLREFGTPLCTPWGIWHPVTVRLNACQTYASESKRGIAEPIVTLSKGVSHGKCI